ncbi:MAG: helix-turn-helix domain-containing protein [Patescibacteria group bacterium]|jgi:sugar-specific transcriptional regulator TrmB
MDRENCQQILLNYGLDQKEAEVYLSMLKTGLGSILKISQATEIKRSTVYLAIESLVAKGLVRPIVKGKKRYYLAEDPEKLVALIDDKKKEIEKIIPLLKSDYLKQSEKPRVTFYEGKEGIKKIYKEALASKKETLWYGSAKDMKEEFTEYYYKMLEVRKTNSDFGGIRDIINNIKVDKDYAKIQNSYNDPRIKVKALRPELLFFNVDNVIFDNKVALLSIKRDFYAVVIESAEIANGYRNMFEMAWRSAASI